jgi:hypothetical protein
MLIANPIYDVFFKFLLEDNEIAKEVISAIIDEDIVELTLKPQENVVQMKEFAFTVLRMDFHAVIQTKEGKKSVIIEMQKGKYFEDLQRFRKYLGHRYINDTIPIITIYFLGYPLDEKLPAVTFVKRDYFDRYTNQKLDVKNAFIEGLTHNSYIIQILLLKESVKTKLEAILSVFDQTKQSDDHAFILSYSDKLPGLEILQKMIRRLYLAGASEELRKKAEIEDEIETSFKTMARQIQEKEEVIEEKNKALHENKKTIEEKEKTIEEKEKTIEENKKTIEESQKTLQEKERILKEQEQIIAELRRNLNSV